MKMPPPTAPKEAPKPEPIITTVGRVRAPGGWRLVTIRTQGSQVLSREMGEADLAAIILSRAMNALERGE